MITSDLLTEAYREYQPKLYGYITRRINDAEDARDLTQDVFCKLLEYDVELQPATIKYLIYKVAQNAVNDYLRHHYVKREVDTYLADYAPRTVSDTAHRAEYHSVARLERDCLGMMPERRRQVYMMRRFRDMSAQEIADELALSRRTVESHLLTGTHEMRRYISACI